MTKAFGYGSINHPVDTCQACGYKGVILRQVPCLPEREYNANASHYRYLTGDLSTWNSAKRAEERDRVKHG